MFGFQYILYNIDRQFFFIFSFHVIILIFTNALQEVYEQQKELILLGERVVLATLVEAIKKFKVAQNVLAQVAWNFVNDGYDTCRYIT